MTQADEATWDAHPLLCLAIERLWIHAGNFAESYRLASGLPSGTGPWSELVDYRNFLAHVPPDRVSPDRVCCGTDILLGTRINLQAL